MGMSDGMQVPDPKPPLTPPGKKAPPAAVAAAVAKDPKGKAPNPKDPKSLAPAEPEVPPPEVCPSSLLLWAVLTRKLPPLVLQLMLLMLCLVCHNVTALPEHYRISTTPLRA